MQINGLDRGVQNLLAMLAQVIKLTGVHCPREHAQDRQDQQHRQGDQHVEDVHERWGLYRDKRQALMTTTSELQAMPRPAAQGGNMPASAKGTQTRL